MFEAGGEPFAGGDPNRLFIGQASVAVQVVGPERRLDEVEIELFPSLEHSQRRVGVGEGVLHVDEQLRVGANRFTHAGQNLGRAFPWFAHAGVGERARQRDLRFHRVKAQRDGAKSPLDE